MSNDNDFEDMDSWKDDDDFEADEPDDDGDY